MDNKSVLTRTAKIWMGDDGILRNMMLPKAEITREDVQENYSSNEKLLNGQKVPILTDARYIKSIDQEARKLSAGEMVAAITIAIAVLVESPMSRMMGNFFLKINRPLYPVKLFTVDEDAVTWLKKYTG